MIDLQIVGGVATVMMCQPPVNAMSSAFLAAFTDAIDQLRQRTDISVVCIRSDQRCFSAGADLRQIQNYFAEHDGPQRTVQYVSKFHELFARIEALPSVTVALINGPALGGGLELALSCDLRIAARAAKLGLPEARVGLIPGAGGTQRLTRLCGLGIASRLILTGEVIDGDEAQRIGLAQWSVPGDELEDRARDLAERVASLSRPALQAAKDCIRAYFDPAVDGYARELETPLTLMNTPEARERIGAFFAATNR
jgi:enoyl-CoA hydratase